MPGLTRDCCLHKYSSIVESLFPPRLFCAARYKRVSTRFGSASTRRGRATTRAFVVGLVRTWACCANIGRSLGTRLVVAVRSQHVARLSRRCLLSDESTDLDETAVFWGCLVCDIADTP